MQFPRAAPLGNGGPLWSRILGCTFPDELKGESASRFETRFWDVVSPERPQRGGYVPFCGLILGRVFPSGLFGKMHPTLAAGPTLISHVLEHVLSSFNTAGKLPFFGKVHVPKLTWFS